MDGYLTYNKPSNGFSLHRNIVRERNYESVTGVDFEEFTPEPMTPVFEKFKQAIKIHVVDPFKAAADGANPYITLDFIPTELDYKVGGSFSAIKLLGRNNPKYHFGGGEDTLSFQIDWYHFSKDAVVRKCRAVEALTKANGYGRRPPVIYIQWGQGDTIFKNHFFIMTSASYKLSHFSKNHIAPNSHHKLINLKGYYPTYGKQTVILKRITPHSLTWKEILR